jgi:hypothetical protein
MAWNPWRALRERHHLTLEWEELDGASAAIWEHPVITLDPRRSRIERNAGLAHELIHEERRIGRPDASDATMQTEERIVRAITADRLVPRDELVAMIEARAPEGLELHEIAGHFEVPEKVAADAVGRLQRELLEAELRRSRMN